MHPPTVRPWRMEREPGRGPMGEVVLATDPRSDWQVAIKALSAHLVQDPDCRVSILQVQTEPTFSASEPKVLYCMKDLKTQDLAFAPDGRLLVVLQGEREGTTKQVDLRVNFLDRIRARLAAAT